LRLTVQGSLRRMAGPLASGLRKPAGRIALLLAVLLVSAFSLAGSGAQSSASRASEVQIHLERGQAALRAQSPATAVKEFQEVLALDPRNAQAYANLGVVAFFERDYPQASKYLGRALAIQPSLVKIQALQGICEAKLGNGSAQVLLETSFPKLQDRPLRTQVGMVLARLYYQEGDLDRAAAVARVLVDLNPDDLSVLFMAQRIYTDLAYDTTNKLAVLAPGSAQMQEVIAERLVNAGDLQDAIDHYKKALVIDPRLPGVHFELGEAILQSAPAKVQNQTSAKQEFEMAARMEGDSAGIESALGEIAFRQSKLDDAYSHYRRAFAMEPGSAEADLGLGKVLMTAGKPGQAIRYLRMAIRSDPLNADAHYRLAEACRRLNLTEESKREFRLFQEIKQTKDQVRALYKEMNGRTHTGGM
jgi:tetratricopeptide (TPR) repeat protein